jgi:hypothetical protein
VRETIFLRGNATFVPSHTAALKRGDFGRKSRLLAKFPQISHEQLKGPWGQSPWSNFFEPARRFQRRRVGRIHCAPGPRALHGSEAPSQYRSAQHCRPRQYEIKDGDEDQHVLSGHVPSGALPEPPIGSGGCGCLFRSSNSLISCSARESSSLHASARDWSSCCPVSNSSISWSSSVRRWCNSWSTRSYWLMWGDFTRALGSAAACCHSLRVKVFVTAQLRGFLAGTLIRERDDMHH